LYPSGFGGAIRLTTFKSGAVVQICHILKQVMSNLQIPVLVLAGVPNAKYFCFICRAMANRAIGDQDRLCKNKAAFDHVHSICMAPLGPFHFTHAPTSQGF